jgi:GxxExxY protein
MGRSGDTEFLLGEETFRIRGAIFEVHRTLGPGFLESVYQECLGIELQARDVPFRATPGLQIQYKGQPLRQTYSPDFLCFDSVIVELKAVRELAPEHRAQLCNYLKATRLRVGLLVNFGAPGRAAVERMVI